MVQPVNYLRELGFGDPQQKYQQGAQLGQQIGQGLLGMEQRQHAQQEQQRQEQLRKQDLSFNQDLSKTLEGGGDLNELLAQNPQRFKQINQLQTYQKQLKQTGAQDIAGQVYLALDQDNPAQAAALLKSPAAQSIISGMGEQELTPEVINTMLQEDPEGLKDLALSTYRFAGGDLTRIGIKDPAKVGKTAAVNDYEYYQELKKTDKKGAAQFGRKAGFISREGEKLPDFFARKLSGANEAAFESEESAAKIEKLSGEFKQVTIQGGLTQKWKEVYNQSVGTPDAVSNLKIRFHGIKSSNLKQYLPPGSATEFEVKNALRAFPPDSATSEQLSIFLDAMAKAERARGKFESFKADFISKNKSERTKDGKSMFSEWKRTLKEDEAAQKSAAIDKEVEQAETVTQTPPPDQSPEQQAIINNLIQSLQPQPQQQPVLSPQEQALRSAYGRRGG